MPKKSFGLIIVSLSVVVVLFFAAFSLPSNALPPRETPTPTPIPNQPAERRATSVPSAYIELNAPTSGWAAVQWQGEGDIWHNVEGWQGAFTGNARWWVAAKDFGTGPFRWQVLSGPDGDILGTSAPFMLPQVGQTANISLIIE